MLDRIEPGRGGELQLTDAIALLLEQQSVFGCVCRRGRYDVGQKLDFLRANVELALDRADLGPAFGEWLREYVARGDWHRVYTRVGVIPLADAQATILDAVDAAGAAPVRAAPTRAGSCSRTTSSRREPVPPFANTGMDGYAVRAGRHARDAAASSGELPAGRAPTIAVGPGEAIRIMTGAPMPDGADAVVMVERTRVDGDRGRGRGRASSASTCARAGGDVEAGDLVFEARHRAHARAPRRAREPRRARGVVPSAAARRRDLDRRRARRARPARAGPHPRLEPADAARAGRGARLRRRRRRHRRATTSARSPPRSRRAADDVRRAADERRGVGRRLRLREARARTASPSERGGTSLWAQVAIKPAKPLAFAMLGARARVRAAGQSGVVAGELRAASPGPRCASSRAAPTSRPSPCVAIAAVGDAGAGPTASCTSTGCGCWLDDGRYVCERAGAQASNVLSGMAARQRPRPARPTARASRPAPRCRSCCSERDAPARGRDTESRSCRSPDPLSDRHCSVVQLVHNGVARAGEMQCQGGGNRVASARRHAGAGVTLHTRGSEDPSAEVGRCAGGEPERTHPRGPRRTGPGAAVATVTCTR